ncbi:MAG: hypothetical protein H6745_18315 [Deltaproteobacteria bacterium]|nr:hypothetical protein [Deltaproteobacteria bacterium]
MRRTVFSLILALAAFAVALALPACDGDYDDGTTYDDGVVVTTENAALVTLRPAVPTATTTFTLVRGAHESAADLQTADYGKRLLVDVLVTFSQPPEPWPGPATLRFGVVGLDLEGVGPDGLVLTVDEAGSYTFVGTLRWPCLGAGCEKQVAFVLDRLDDGTSDVDVAITLE